MRGHSSIESALDVAVRVERLRGLDTLTLRSTKSRDAPLQPLSVLWKYESEGPRLVSGRFFCLGKAEGAATGAAKAAKAAKVILDELEDGMNQSQVAALVKQRTGVGRNTTLSALDGLVARGKLSTTPGPHHSRIYHRAAGSSPPAA